MQGPSDHEQKDDEQQRERQVENGRCNIAGKQVAANLELAKARQLGGERRPFRQRERKAEHGREGPRRHGPIRRG
jgi:hypothetical protein